MCVLSFLPMDLHCFMSCLSIPLDLYCNLAHLVFSVCTDGCKCMSTYSEGMFIFNQFYTNYYSSLAYWSSWDAGEAWSAWSNWCVCAGAFGPREKSGGECKMAVSDHWNRRHPAVRKGMVEVLSDWVNRSLSLLDWGNLSLDAAQVPLSYIV